MPRVWTLALAVAVYIRPRNSRKCRAANLRGDARATRVGSFEGGIGVSG
jgi:hypothetical protein